MPWKTGDVVTADFTTQTPSTGAATDADSTPTATLVINGTDSGTSVTVTNKATGSYKAAVTLPTIADSDLIQIRVAATVGGIAGKGVVWAGQGYVGTEPGQVAPPATASPWTKIAHLFKAFRNKKTQTATQFSLYDDAGTTVDQKATVSDDGTTFSSGEVVSGP